MRLGSAGVESLIRLSARQCRPRQRRGPEWGRQRQAVTLTGRLPV